MKTKIDIQKILQGKKKITKSNRSFDQALLGLGVSIAFEKQKK